MDQLRGDIHNLYVNITDHFVNEGNEGNKSLSEFAHAFDEVYYDERDSTSWHDRTNLTALHDAMALISKNLFPSSTQTSAKLRALCEKGSPDFNVNRILNKICKFKVHAGLAAINTAIKKIKAQKNAAAARFEKMRLEEIKKAKTQAEVDAIAAAAAQEAAQAAAQAAAEEAEVRRQAEAAMPADEVRRYLDLLEERGRRFQGGKKKSGKKGGKKSGKKGGKKSHKKGGKKSHKKSHKRRH
jgi:hypothetical protein